ncbi:MAG: DUF3048 domain-containing protein [Deinococcota bacterium]
MLALWQNPDRRRAALLSFILHALVLWGFISLYRAPQRPPQESFIVIDVGTPQRAAVTTQAPSATADAPQAAVPEVADTETGLPSETPALADTQPLESTPVTEPAPEPQPIAETPVETPIETPPVTPAPEPVAETPPVTAEPVTDPTPPEPVAATPPQAAPAPTNVPEITDTAEVSTTSLPEVETPVVETNEPLTRSLPIPEVTSEVTDAQTVSLTPTVNVAAETAIPNPQPQVTITPERTVPTPQTAVAVQPAVAVPVPSTSVTVNPQSLTAQPVATSEVVPETPTTSSTTASTSTPTTPVDADAGSVAAVPSRETPSNVDNNLPQGGSSDASGQTTSQPEASLENTGLATSPDGGEGTGSPAPASFEPFRDTRQRPLMVILDNVFGYPQSGLLEASAIYELPVEGGVTRLMASFDRIDPSRVGPIRSARDYFVDLAQAGNGVLVHAGGSPGALQAIETRSASTLDALQDDAATLFSRSSGSAPYNLYSQGNALRSAINRLNLGTQRDLNTNLYIPSEDAIEVSGMSASYGAIYGTGFRYIAEVNQYRWQRDGSDATDASGQAVLVDAVLLARISATPYPDDPEGRLYIPMSSGEATLFLRGRQIPGRWQLSSGVSFQSDAGEVIDLAPFKHWVVFAPTYSQVQVF